jgi:hypothetical protein
MISFACIAVTSRFYRKQSEVHRKSVKLLSFESFPPEYERRIIVSIRVARHGYPAEILPLSLTSRAGPV